MLDIPAHASGLAYYFDAYKETFGEPSVPEIAADLGVTEKQFYAWMKGKKVDDVNRAKLSLLLSIPAWMLQEGYEESMGTGSHCVIPTNRIYVPSGSDFEGYWGNIGFKVPGREKSIWMSCSDSQASKFYEHVVNGQRSTVCLKGMGLFSYIASPGNLKALRGIPEAGDPVPGDWEIDDRDPVDGLNVGYMSLIASGFEPEFDEAYEKISEELRAFMGHMAGEVGGQEKLDEALREITVFYKDGTEETFHVDYLDTLFQETVSNFFHADDMAEYLEDLEPGEHEEPTSLKFNDNDCPVVIPMANVALVRFPMIYTDPRRLVFKV